MTKIRVVNFVILCLVSILLEKNCVKGSKLNVPRVLLPLFNDFSTNFTLESVKGGCYKWKTSRLDVIQLLPVDEDPLLGCSSKAILSTISKELIRNTVTIFAEEESSGQVLQCNVIVNVISYLNIVATTKEIFMEEAPELFEVRAYDDQGNEFSTLEGVEFHWSIGNWNDHSHSTHGSSVSRFISFRDSSYKTPPTIAKFESLGLRGHIVLIEGIKTGSSKISVQLPHAEYRHVSPSELQLTVVANLLIDPPDVYIIKGDIIKYKLSQLQHGKLEEIRLPSSQYYLEIEDTSIAVMEQTSSLVRGLSLGQTKIILRDKHSDSSDSSVRLPTATLTVATPAYLTLNLLPHRNWVVLVDQMCTIVIELFDSDNHKMCVGESTVLETTVPANMFNILPHGMTRNGTYLTGVALQPGVAPVTSTLVSVRGFRGEVDKISPAISTQAELEIFPKLAIKPSEIILLWYPQTQTSKRNEAKLAASGGDGMYMWSSLNQSVAIVTQSGIVKSQNQGQTEVIVSMQRNQHNRETAKVFVLPPVHMEIIEYIQEAEVDTPIYIHVALFAHKQVFGRLKHIPFTHCQDLVFNVAFTDDTFYYNSSAVTTPVGIACATVAVLGKKIGSTKVTVSYKQDDVELESSTIVGTFQPITIIHPSAAETVLAVGSSRHVVWTGGPRPWLSRNYKHLHTLDYDRGIVNVRELFSNQQGTYVYSVVCMALGEADVTLTVENRPSLANCKGAASASTVKVYCSKPSFVSLSTRPVTSQCPTTMNTERVVAHCSTPVKLLITVKDDQGRVFDNATSFDVDWTLSKRALATIGHRGQILLEEKVEDYFTIPLDHYQMLIPQDETGIIKVSVRLTGYRRAILNSHDIIPESPPFVTTNEIGDGTTPLIETTIMIILVNDTVITPNQTSIFNHPSNKIILKVSDGSGHYKIILSSQDVATVTYIDSTRSLEVVPKMDGTLKIALGDLCLESQPAVAEVQVLRVGSIKVDVVDRIEKGHCVTAHVHLYDSLDNPLSILDVELLELRSIVESDIITVKPVVSSDKKDIKFTVSGIELGETKFTFASGRGANEIQSAPISIQVFPPLRLLPRNLTLTIGGVFQLNAAGGPQPDSNMEYSSSEQAIAKVSATGLIEASRLGNIVITGMAIGFNKITGNKIIFCKDRIEVHVVPLEGIKIQIPLLRLKVGARVPVWVGGIPEQLSPLVLGTIQPNLLFKWQVSSPDVVELRDVFSNAGIEVPDEDRLSVRIKALKPGRATLNLNVTIKGAIVKCPDKSSVVLSDFVILEVFEELRLIKPDLGTAVFNPLLLAPDSTFQLVTNKDGIDQIKYNVLGYPFTSTSSTGSSGSNKKTTALTKQTTSILTVSSNGFISTGTSPGRALILLRSDKDYSVDQTIGVNVEVKPVYYLMMNINTKLRVDPTKQITALPRGLDLEIFITYHDNTGTEFASTKTNLKFRSSRIDKVHIKRGSINGTLHANLVGSGTTVLKVWDEAIPYHSQDYIKFSVDHLMFPDKTVLTVGDVVCFSMPLLSQNNKLGTWSSADSDILVIEDPIGVGRATGKTGSALVTYYLSDSITATTAMQVLPTTAISFFPLSGRNITNSQSVFLAPLLLQNDQLMDRTRNMIASDNVCHSKDFQVSSFPFSCQIRFNSAMTPLSVNEVFTVEPHFSSDTGVYSCQLEAVGLPSANTSVLQLNITLRAVSGKVVSDPLVIPFLPAVFIHTPEIHLSDKQSSAFFTVTGTPQVLEQVQILSEDAMLRLGPKELISQNSLSFQVKINQRFWATNTKLEQKLYITLISELTSQNVQIPVIIHVKGDVWLTAPCLGSSNNFMLPDFNDSSNNFYTIVISLIIIFIVLYYGYFMLLRRRHTPSSVFTGSPENIHGTRIFQTSSPIKSPGDSTFLTRQPFSNMEPVYGDPNISHHSPDRGRRTRKLVT